jgi:DMSO/TMAO reductase YedYZ molybdopterin-dependent catalytic subunit
MTATGARPEIDHNAPTAQRAARPPWAGAAAGLAAATLAVGSGQLAAAIAGTISPLDAAGSEFIDHTPSWLKQWAIDTFGTADKTALRVGMVLTIAVLAATVGRIARRSPRPAAAVFAAAGVGASLVAAGRPSQSAAAAAAPLIAGAVGAAALLWLVGHVRAHDALAKPGGSRAPLGWDRRRFVGAAGGAAAFGAFAALSARKVESDRSTALLDDAPDSLPPVPADAAATPDEGATLSPVTPFITPNDNFYRIDTALSLPRIDIGKWKVDIKGMVDSPLALSFDDLLARPQVERTITIACVSNEVGGELIGNAVWQGVLLRDLLDEAGVQPNAEQVFSTSDDGWTCGFPVEAAVDGRDAMIAIGMNGEPLPLQHGFPARLIIPGLYGYVSATKWLRTIKLTTWDDDEGYWIPRGWAREAPIKTQSRIDVPRRGDEVAAGSVVIAGIAWAQRRGVAKVEVRVDEGQWREAALADDVSIDTWRQWRIDWDLDEGEHTVQVRATDNTGETQTDEVARPDPDGATGWHTRRINVAR